jgi:hypothetical protein
VTSAVASMLTGGPPICAKMRPLTPECVSERSIASDYDYN